MQVQHLSVTDFRNYQSAELALRPGLNLLLGHNGQGKTNLAEAIGYFSTLSSHRVHGDQALIRAGANAAIVRMRVQFRGRPVLLELKINSSGANQAQINRAAQKPRELPHYFSSVLFAPEDLAIVRGEPAVRRKFLDERLIADSPRMIEVLAEYDRVVKQRNSLLKSAKIRGLRDHSIPTMEIWDERLVALGSEIIRARLLLVATLQQPLRAAYSYLVQADHAPTMAMLHSIDSIVDARAEHSVIAPASPLPAVAGQTLDVIAQQFRSSLERVRAKERERAQTLVGPHRDDLQLELNGLPVKGYASHGESWSFVLALRLAAAEHIRTQSSHGDPVLILDDVFAELDVRRRNRLLAAIVGYEQVLVTAAVAADVPDGFTWNIIHVDRGTLRQQRGEQ